MSYTTIPGYEQGEGNWRFIASPLVEDAVPTTVNNMITEAGYDLYYFNQSASDGEWQNYKANSFNLTNGQGYLYANTEEVNLIFKGEFNEEDTKTVDLAYDATARCAGWNLVGNPFPVNAYLLDENNEAMPFFKMNDTGDAIVAAQPGTAIEPFEGVFVICPNDGEAHSAIFTTTAPANLGNAQSVPPVVLPLHDLLVNQDASLIITQTITLSQGWNWFSTYVEITLDDLKAALVAALPGSTNITITSQSNGSTTYNGTRWRGQLNTIDLSQMYKIQTTAAGEMTLEGMPVNPAEYPVTLHHGNNWITFPLGQSMSLTDAFAGFAVNGDMVISQFGSATYTNGHWRGQLSILEPGKGYLYYSNSTMPKTLIFVIPTK